MQAVGPQPAQAALVSTHPGAGVGIGVGVGTGVGLGVGVAVDVGAQALLVPLHALWQVVGAQWVLVVPHQPNWEQHCVLPHLAFTAAPH